LSDRDNAMLARVPMLLYALGVENDAPLSDIRKAWKDTAAIYHPDRVHCAARGRAEARLKEINEAFQWLVTHWVEWEASRDVVLATPAQPQTASIVESMQCVSCGNEFVASGLFQVRCIDCIKARRQRVIAVAKGVIALVKDAFSGDVTASCCFCGRDTQRRNLTWVTAGSVSGVACHTCHSPIAELHRSAKARVTAIVWLTVLFAAITFGKSVSSLLSGDFGGSFQCLLLVLLIVFLGVLVGVVEWRRKYTRPGNELLIRMLANVKSRSRPKGASPNQAR